MVYVNVLRIGLAHISDLSVPLLFPRSWNSALMIKSKLNRIKHISIIRRQ